MNEGFALCEAIWDDTGKLSDYVIVQVNPALRAMLGMGPELAGKKLSETGLSSPAWLEICEQVLLSGEPISFEFHNDATGLWHEIRLNRTAPNRLAQFFFDISARKQAEEQLVASQSYLRLILDAAADAFYCVDRNGTTTHCNAAFLRMLGFESDSDVLGRRLHDVIHHSHPDGSPYDKGDCPIYQCAQTGDPRHIADELFFRRDGSGFPVEYWVRPILRDGVQQGAICTFQDVTERKAAEEARDLLLRELNHRVKNLFAVVNGVVSLSSRSLSGPRETAMAIRGRLDALARAHDLILPKSLKGDAGLRRTDLAILANAVLSAYADGVNGGSSPRLTIEGPRIVIGDRTATAMALVLHELATNAVKYGAFANAAGHVSVSWFTKADELHLRWRERGGPRVMGPPQSDGFGAMLSRRSVAGQLHGELRNNWDPDGLVVEITAPLEHLAS